MKRILFIISLFLGTYCYAAQPVLEMPIQSTNGGEVVAVSTASWTVGWSTAYSGTSGFYITNAPGNTYDVYMTIESSAPSISTTTIPIVLKPGVTQYHAASEVMYPYLISNGSSAQNVYILRVHQ